MPIEYKDYENKTPREQAVRISKGIDKPHHIGVKSTEVKKQELISHIQSFQETFNNQEMKLWKNKLRELELA